MMRRARHRDPFFDPQRTALPVWRHWADRSDPHSTILKRLAHTSRLSSLSHTDTHTHNECVHVCVCVCESVHVLMFVCLDKSTTVRVCVCVYVHNQLMSVWTVCLYIDLCDHGSLSHCVCMLRMNDLSKDVCVCDTVAYTHSVMMMCV